MRRPTRSSAGRWEEWHPNVPLVTLRTAHRSIAQPIVKYLKTRIEAEERYRASWWC